MKAEKAGGGETDTVGFPGLLARAMRHFLFVVPISSVKERAQSSVES